jgi:hypothetical protein
MKKASLTCYKFILILFGLFTQFQLKISVYQENENCHILVINETLIKTRRNIEIN